MLTLQCIKEGKKHFKNPENQLYFGYIESNKESKKLETISLTTFPTSPRLRRIYVEANLQTDSRKLTTCVHLRGILVTFARLWTCD
uniref:Uncharacterized protein n=1 Tax=Sinocyclocheilus rhinocerous TaxID=307959 RepID=A0A673M7J2_9TELE